jgi:peroxiredoxin
MASCNLTARCSLLLRLVTISTDNRLETNEFRTAVGAGWTLLSDPGRRLQKDLDRGIHRPTTTA